MLNAEKNGSWCHRNRRYREKRFPRASAEKIDEAVDFNWLYEMVEPLYSEDNGRPSVDPVVLFKNGSDPASVRPAISAADGG